MLFDQILKAAPHKTETIWPLTSHLPNQTSKTNKIFLTLLKEQKSADYLRFPMDTSNTSSLCEDGMQTRWPTKKDEQLKRIERIHFISTGLGKWLNISIWPIERTLGTIPLVLRGPGSNCKEGLIHIFFKLQNWNLSFRWLDFICRTLVGCGGI